MKVYSRFSRAFTMIELMITMMIIGVLVSVAVVSYTQYVLKSKLSEAYTAINGMTLGQTAYFLTSKQFFYENFATPIGNDPAIVGAGRKVSPPFPVGSKVLFTLATFPGRTDASGAEISGTQPDGNYFWTKVGGYTPATMRTTNCIGIRFETYVTAEGKPQYNWVLLTASRDLVDDSNPECTYVMKLVDTGASGGVNTGNAIINLNPGK